MIQVGCAGWSLPREHWPEFAEEGTHLERYASSLSAVEINSSFYRPHRPQTWQRWAESVPAGFRFSVKMPKSITHEHRLQGCEHLLEQFLTQCLHLKDKLGCLLVQLPPSLTYDPTIATAFFEALRKGYDGSLVIEPRHGSWRDAESLLNGFQVGQVAADPSPITGGDTPGGWSGVQYWRLHGSPRLYHSAYELAYLQELAVKLKTAADAGLETWCIFDNTASGHAVHDALLLRRLLA